METRHASSGAVIHAVSRNGHDCALPLVDGSRVCNVVLPVPDRNRDTRFPEDMASYCQECVAAALSYISEPWFELPADSRRAAFDWLDEEGVVAFDPIVVSFRVFSALEPPAMAARRSVRDDQEVSRVLTHFDSRKKDQDRFHLVDLDLARRPLVHPSGVRLCAAELPSDATGVYYPDDADDRTYADKRYCKKCTQTLLSWAAVPTTTTEFLRRRYWVNGHGVLTDHGPSTQTAAENELNKRWRVEVDALQRQTDELLARVEAAFVPPQVREDTQATTPRHHNKPWTDVDERRAMALYQGGASRSEISVSLGRTESAITRRIGSIMLLASADNAFTEQGAPAFPDLDVPEHLWKRQ